MPTAVLAANELMKFSEDHENFKFSQKELDEIEDKAKIVKSAVEREQIKSDDGMRYLVATITNHVKANYRGVLKEDDKVKVYLNEDGRPVSTLR